MSWDICGEWSGWRRLGDSSGGEWRRRGINSNIRDTKWVLPRNPCFTLHSAMKRSSYGDTSSRSIISTVFAVRTSIHSHIIGDILCDIFTLCKLELHNVCTRECYWFFYLICMLDKPFCPRSTLGAKSRNAHVRQLFTLQWYIFTITIIRYTIYVCVHVNLSIEIHIWFIRLYQEWFYCSPSVPLM